jgi:hypothetical protein
MTRNDYKSTGFPSKSQGGTKQNPDKPILDLLVASGKYVAFFMVAIIICCVVYFSSCKFTYMWRLLQGEFKSYWTLVAFCFSYCIITDGTRIALLLYGLRDFAIGKTQSGWFGIIISVALTGYAFYESPFIAESVVGNTTGKGFEFVCVGFIVTNALALVLEWRMLSSTKGLFQQVYHLDTDEGANEDDEASTALATEMANLNNYKGMDNGGAKEPLPYPSSNGQLKPEVSNRSVIAGFRNEKDVDTMQLQNTANDNDRACLDKIRHNVKEIHIYMDRADAAKTEKVFLNNIDNVEIRSGLVNKYLSEMQQVPRDINQRWKTLQAEIEGVKAKGALLLEYID